jgi:hypothetical protein
MSAGERIEAVQELRCSQRLVNLLVSGMPLHEGLYLATVLDGRSGKLRLCFDFVVWGEVLAMLSYFQHRFPGELLLLPNSASCGAGAPVPPEVAKRP